MYRTPEIIMGSSSNPLVGLEVLLLITIPLIAGIVFGSIQLRKKRCQQQQQQKQQ